MLMKCVFDLALHLDDSVKKTQVYKSVGILVNLSWLVLLDMIKLLKFNTVYSIFI